MTMELFRDAAQRSVSQGVAAAVLCGIVFHFSIRPFEFELVMFHFMAAFTLSFFGMFYVFGLAKALLFATSFSTGLLASIAMYRVFFHRCRKFPGPFAAKVSKFHAASLAAKDVKYFRELEKMHEQYGDFVRTGERTPNSGFARADANSQQRSARDQCSTQVSRSDSLRAQLGMFEVNMVRPNRERPKEMFHPHDA